MKGYFFFFLDYDLRDLNTAKPWAGSPALNRTMSWKYLKLWIFIFFLWLFCKQYLQIATQHFWTQFTGGKRSHFKTSKTQLFGNLREFKLSHPCWDGKITLTTWKSLATNGLGSEGKHDCPWRSHASGVISTTRHTLTSCRVLLSLPTISMEQLEIFSESSPRQFLCVCVCYLLYVISHCV